MMLLNHRKLANVQRSYWEMSNGEIATSIVKRGIGWSLLVTTFVASAHVLPAKPRPAVQVSIASGY
jgi:hypothetical protein